jgi:hypothetical protein
MYRIRRHFQQYFRIQARLNIDGSQFQVTITSYRNSMNIRNNDDKCRWKSTVWLGRRKPEYPEKTTDLPQVTDKLYHPGNNNILPQLNEHTK